MAAARRGSDAAATFYASPARTVSGTASPPPSARALLWTTSPRAGGSLGYGLPVMLGVSADRDRTAAHSPSGTPSWLRSTGRRGSGGVVSQSPARVVTPTVDTHGGAARGMPLFVGAPGGEPRSGQPCAGTAAAEALSVCLQPPRASGTHRLQSSGLSSPGGMSASSVRDGDAVVVTVADAPTKARGVPSGSLCLRTQNSGEGAALEWTNSPAQACTFRVRLWSVARGSPSQRMASPARLAAGGAAVVLGRGRRGSVRPVLRCGVAFTLESEAVPGRFLGVLEGSTSATGGMVFCVGNTPAILMAMLPGAVNKGSARALSFSGGSGAARAKASWVRTAASPMGVEGGGALPASVGMRRGSRCDERKDAASPVLMSCGRRGAWLCRTM